MPSMMTSRSMTILQQLRNSKFNNIPLATMNVKTYENSCPLKYQNQQTHKSNTVQPIQIRHKHSNRQVNRLFRKNPARKRIMSQINGKESPMESKREPIYPPIYEPPGGILANGWSEPPQLSAKDQGDESASEVFVMPDYPFSITRTKNKPNGAIGFLPIYSDYRLGGTRATTIIRKVTGDKSTFISEMGIAIGLSEGDLQKSVRIRAGGTIEVSGLHVANIRQWLVGLGF